MEHHAGAGDAHQQRVRLASHAWSLHNRPVALLAPGITPDVVVKEGCLIQGQKARSIVLLYALQELRGFLLVQLCVGLRCLLHREAQAPAGTSAKT